MNENTIPIKNIYYMLCYAWGYIRQAKTINLSSLKGDNIYDLLSIVLIQGTQHIYRRGFELGYKNHNDILSGVKGKIDITNTTKRFLTHNGKLHCVFDELTVDVITNQIIKSTLKLLYTNENIHNDLKLKISSVLKFMRPIREIDLNSKIFRIIQLNGNNKFYKFIIAICQLVYTSSFISQEKGRVNFYDFIRDEREMSRIFQEFLYQFMKKEYIGWSVSRPHIKWDASSDTDPELKLLPRMESDIIMSNADKTIIIDAKHYKNMYTNRYNRAKFHSNNLYQLMCYLHNYDFQETKQNKNTDGMLIYPMTGDSVNETYTINNYKITLRTLNLNQEWNKIHDELLNIFITP